MTHVRKNLKSIGKFLVYASTGLLPSRCQNYLAEKYEWYNPDHATFASSVTEAWAGTALSYVVSPVFLYPTIEGISRLLVAAYKDIKLHKTPSVGTLIFEAPVFAAERIYGKGNQKNISEINNGLTLKNNDLERLLY